MMQSDMANEENKIFNIEKYYHANGALYKAVPIDVKGRAHGVESVYRENGALWSQHPHQNGLLHGTERFFNENGEMYLARTYENGTPLTLGIK